MTIKEHYSDLIFRKIDLHKLDNANRIFVIQGQISLINLDLVRTEIVDLDTFYLEKDEQIFDKTWFSKVFTTLNQTKDFHLLSFAQFSYLINYIDPSFFIDRVILLVDNLRQIYPIDEQDYLEKDEIENIELRPEKLPIYQAKVS